MSRPRQVLPGQFYLLTRSCTQRQFLLRPDDTTNNAFVYCLGEAAQRFEIDILLPVAMSNHHHTVLFDRHGRYPQFVEHFHKMIARCMNARWGRWENLWAAEEACVTRLLDRDTVIDKLVYTATNPVKDLLVEHAFQWPGVNGYRQLIHRKPVRAKRPTHFFREHGLMPETVTLTLVIPPELGDADAVIAELRDRVEQVEREVRERRATTGATILGRRRVLEQSWRSSPTSVEPRRNLRPRFAGNAGSRVEALVGYKEFLATYRYARLSWQRGAAALFPRGTYWLARFAPITLMPSPE
jgi:REP element-mobilizing transposase RayT